MKSKLSLMIYLLLMVSGVYAQYNTNTEVLSSGGGESSSSSYSNFGIIGQIFTNSSITGGEYEILEGFISAVNSDSGTPSGLFSELKSETIKLFPNPTSKVIYFESNQITVNKIIIYTILGEKVYDDTLENTCIDVSNLPGGIYIIEFINNHNKVTSRFIKQ